MTWILSNARDPSFIFLEGASDGAYKIIAKVVDRGDARVMATAQDMLEALQAMIAEHHGAEDIALAYEMAEAAVAKAMSETS